MGAMVGAAYSAGIEIPRLIEIAAEAGWRQISRPTWPRHGLLSFEKWKLDAQRIGDVDLVASSSLAAVVLHIEPGEH